MIPKQLISVRLDADLIERIDKVASTGRHLTRSGVINELLQFVVHAASDFQLLKMYRTYPKSDADFTAVCNTNSIL